MAKRKTSTKNKEMDIRKKPSDFVNKKLIDISSEDGEITFHFIDGEIKVTGDNFKICIN